LIVTAEIDPLRDDGEAYARRLIEAGVAVQVRRYIGLPHGFLSLPPSIPCVASALDEVCHALKDALRGNTPYLMHSNSRASNISARNVLT
jgi:acetyl esterase